MHFSTINIFCLITSLILSIQLCSAQQREDYNDERFFVIDSLINEYEAQAGSGDKSVVMADKLYDLIEKVVQDNNDEYITYILSQRIQSRHAASRYAEAISVADSVLSIYENYPEQKGFIYYVQFLKSIIFVDMGRYKSAIQLAQNLYDVSKQPIIDYSGDDVRINVHCNALTALGLAYIEMEQYVKAIECFTEGIDMLAPQKVDSTHTLQRLELQTNRLAAAQKLPIREVALKYINNYENELNEFDEFKQNTVYSDVFTGDFRMLLEVAYIDVYTDMSNIRLANQHIEIANKLKDENDLAMQYLAELNNAKAKFYSLVGNYTASVAYADSSAQFYSKSKKYTNHINALKTKLSSIHKLGSFSQEYLIANKIFSLSDSVYQQRYTSQVEDMQTMMQMDKLEQKTQRLQAERQLVELRASKQRQLMFIIIGIIIFVALTAFLLFKRRRDMERHRILSRQKEMLEEEVNRQTEQIREQRDEIASKNRDITDSINYALRIQQSILPNLDAFKGYDGTGGAFAFYVPCHIVSGDFYWAATKGDIEMFACADCTGHGVPGAFMSMIGTTILNDLVSDDLVDPAEILERLHERLIGILQQNGEEDSRDGMDMALVVFNRNNKTASAASARRPVYFYLESGLVIFKGTKRSIGERDYNRENMPFETHVETVYSGDTIYMSSDGMPDQFGGPTERGKRLKNSGMEAMMEKVVQLPIAEQQKAVHDFYYEWRNDKGQLDDISFLGIRF